MIREFSLFDNYGELISTTTTKSHKVRGDWIMFFAQPLRRLIDQAPNFITLKVYLLLASKQTFGKYVLTTRKQLKTELGITYGSLRTALSWLEDNNFLREVTVEGNCGWLLNPKITSRGAKYLDEKKEEWLKSFEEALENEREKRRENRESSERLGVDS